MRSELKIKSAAKRGRPVSH